MAPEPGDVFDFLTSDSVRRAANERIQREALRQLDTVDLDDDHSRIEPLPSSGAPPVAPRQVPRPTGRGLG